MEENITPEEKLLRLIKEGNKKASKKDYFRFLGIPKNSFRLFKIISLILIFLVGVVFFATFFDIIFLKNRLPDIEKEIVSLQEETKSNKAEDAEIPSYKEIDEAISKRDLFKLDSDSGIRTSEGGAAGTDISQNLNLLGIITGERPQAIIEDRMLKKSFFLYKGDSFGDFKVIEIKEGTVILDNRGERIELRL